ncbi:MAG: DUF2231 domain-containing protein [Gaiellaceae bacterium]
MKLSYLLRGLPGHPLHPPLTDATIGIYTFATIAGLADVLGISETSASQGWWLALFAGLIVTGATALTGLVDWLDITRGSELWKTATMHMAAMLTATVFFLIALLTGRDDFHAGNLTASALILTLVGFGLLTLGGWLGGTIVYVHGMRVLNLVEEPADRAVSPTPKPEKEAAEES